MHASSGQLVFGDTKEGMMGIRTNPKLRLKNNPKHGVNSYCHVRCHVEIQRTKNPAAAGFPVSLLPVSDNQGRPSFATPQR